jgi:hypothetical protein
VAQRTKSNLANPGGKGDAEVSLSTADDLPYVMGRFGKRGEVSLLRLALLQGRIVASLSG